VLSEPGRRWVASTARSLRGRRAGCSIASLRTRPVRMSNPVRAKAKG
jgi:hypothetical protein